MSERRRIVLLILIMAVVAVISSGVALAILYRTAFEEKQGDLSQTVQIQARLIEAMVLHEIEETPELAFRNVIALIAGSLERHQGTGNTSEFLLARRDGDQIVFVLRHRHREHTTLQAEMAPLPFQSTADTDRLDPAEPMRRALSGQSGTMIGRNDQGKTVLTAYAPIAGLDLGIVTKIDLAAIRAPFLEAGGIVAFLAMVTVIFGAGFFFRVSNPMIRKMQESEQRFRDVAEVASDWIWETDADLRFTYISDRFQEISGVPPEQATGLTRRELFADHVTDRDGLENHFKTIEAHLPYKDFEVRWRRPDGTVRVIRNSGKPIFDSRGIFKGYRGIATDITEGKKAEEKFTAAKDAVTEAEDRQNEAVRIAQIGHWVFDEVNERLTYCSEEYARIYGYTREELLTNIDSISADLELAHPDDREWLEQAYREAVAQGKSYANEHRGVRKDGAVRYVRELGNPIFDDDGRCIQTFGICMDITERKLAEEAIKDNEKVLRAFLDATADPVMLVNADATIHVVNRAMADLYGIPQLELIGRPMFKTPPTETGRRRIQWIDEVLRTGRPIREEDEHEGRWYDNSYYPVLDSDSKTTRVAIFARDITVRKRAEAALKQSETRFRKLFEKAPLGYQSLNIEGKFIEINQAWLDMFGYSREEVIDHEFEDFLVEEGFVKKNLPRFKEAGEIQLPGTEMRCKDGSIKLVHIEGRIGTDEQGKFLQTHCILADITEREMAEEKLRKAYDEMELRVDERTRALSHEITERIFAEETLQQANLELESRVDKRTRSLRNAKEDAEFANYSKTQFLANMSHELRTPLNSVIGFSEIMKEEAFGPLGDDKYVEYANDINMAGDHLLRIINDILDISRIEAGESDVIEDEVDIREANRTCISMLNERAKNVQVMLKTEIADDIPRLLADETRIKQILINLLSNAIKFTPPKGMVTMEAEVDEQKRIVFKISDTGIGIPAEDIPRVLEPFAQVEDIMNRSHDGIGLGLPLSKRLTELHDGTLTIESEVGKGTTITVRFPPERTIRPS